MRLQLGPSVRCGLGVLQLLFKETVGQDTKVTFAYQFEPDWKHYIVQYLGEMQILQKYGMSITYPPPNDECPPVINIVFTRTVSGLLRNSDGFLHATKRWLQQIIAPAEEKASECVEWDDVADEALNDEIFGISRR